MPKCMRCMEDYDQQEFCPYCGRKRNAALVYDRQIPEETILNRRFIIGEALNKDRIGFLYIAWDALLEQKVYIKEWFPVKLVEREQGKLLVKPVIDETLWEKLNSEFLIHAEFFHRQQDISVLVPIYTFFRENNTSYYVMEYVGGETLRNIFQKKNPLELSEATRIMEDIDKALLLLHQRGIIHGNLSPDNILFCEDGKVKLLNPAWFGDGMAEIRNTVFWSRYVPMEYKQIPFIPSINMDSYGAASVFYRMLTGEEPYGVMKDVKEKKLPSVSEYGIEIPGRIEKQIMEILGKKNSKGIEILEFFQVLNVVLLVIAAGLGIWIFL